MPKSYFYITTTLPYVNAEPHLGFALELVQADVIARYHKLLDEEVFFNTGTDEHGLKIYNKAVEQNKDPQTYTNEYAAKFKQLVPALGISSDIHFIRTTEPSHISATQEFWKRCEKNGDIYKAKYKIKYCVGCELEKTESDLDENGRCLLHPNLEIEIREEENYFFKFSKYQEPLLKFYDQHPDFVVPDFRFNEIKQFVKSGLQDFSISRLKSKMPWGVPVPADADHVMYVWFDALINYISTLGWPEWEKSDFGLFWGTKQHPNAVQIAGKDNLRQQSAMWQAMLMSAEVPNSKQIIIHGFINSGGQKMSKSLGNVADPYQILSQLKSKGLSDEQAIDALRYYLLREIPAFEDGDYTWEKLIESYNSGLANGIGNLTSRILKMAVNAGIKNYESEIKGKETKLSEQYHRNISSFNLKGALDAVWSQIKLLDTIIQQEQPFKKINNNRSEAEGDIKGLLGLLNGVALDIQPFLPQTSEKILEALKNPSEGSIPRLFPRIQ